MKIKSYKDKFGYFRVDCPFCGEFAYLASGDKTDELRNLKRHITNAAKNEALDFVLSADEALNVPHLDYYRKHTSDRPIVRSLTKRHFDDDMKI